VGIVIALGLAVVILVALLTNESPHPATVEELDSAIPSAIEALMDSPGVEGQQFGYIDGYLAAAVWFGYRQNGDMAVTQRVDVDVSETAWWLGNSRPPQTGQNISETSWIKVDGTLFEAVAGEGESKGIWTVLDPEAVPPGPLVFGLAMLTEEDYRFGQFGVDGDVTLVDSSDGETWTLTVPYSDGSAVQTWKVDADGILRSWSWELVGVNAPLDDHDDPLNSGRVEFIPLRDPEPIGAPDVGAVVDPQDLGVPEELPLESS
jgi:hypothetical protein